MIWVFGDSFVEDYSESWIRQLAKLRGEKLQAFAKGGTSVEWSALNFMKTKFRDGDTVIFVLSNADRFDVEPFVSHTPASAYTAKNYNSLDENLQWYVRSRSAQLVDLKHTLYTSLIHAISQQYGGVRFLVLCGFDDSKGSSIVKRTNNFMMLDRISLNQISHYEVNELKLNPYMLYNITGHDPRVNHLSSVNLDRLATCVNQVLNTWDDSAFKLKYFAKNVINTHVTTMDELYENYVDTGLMYDEWIEMTKIPVTHTQGSIWHRFKQKILELVSRK